MTAIGCAEAKRRGRVVMSERISRAEAQRRGLARYYSSRPCVRGHVGERQVLTGNCLVCKRAYGRARRRTAAHRERHRVYALAWRSAHPDRVEAARRRYQAAHPDAQLAQSRAWKAAHPDHQAALIGMFNARERAPGCVPADFDYKTTVPFYAEARRRTRETGIPHEVDHIKALGLGGKHIASNLQVLTKAANRKKANAERRMTR